MEFDERKRVFLQQLREYKNQIYYEGFTIKDRFINVSEALMLEIINTIKEYLKERV